MSEEAGEAADKAAEAIEKRNQKRFDWATKVFLPLVCVCIGAVGGAAAKYGFDQASNRMRVIKYAVVSTPSLLRTAEVGKRDLKITLDGQPITNLSSATIHVFNDKFDLEKVALYVKVGRDGRKTMTTYEMQPTLPSDVYAPDGKVQIVSEKDGSTSHRFDLAVLNRSQSFQINCLFEGDTPPPIELYTIARGVTTEHISLDQKSESGGLSLASTLLSVFAAMTGLSAVMFTAYAYGRTRSLWRKQQTRYEEAVRRRRHRFPQPQKPT